MASRAKNSDRNKAVEIGAEAQEQNRLLDTTREEKIRCRAYEIYLERGGEPGHDLEDWFQAEQEFTTGESKPAGQ